jgi:hypothetical protein
MADDGAEQKVRAVVEKVKLFTLNKEEFELIYCGKPTTSGGGGEVKTDIYIKAKKLSNQKIEEVKISYKKPSFSFVENKIKKERAEKIYGEKWSKIIQSQITEIKKEFQQKPLIYFEKKGRIEKGSITLGWRYEMEHEGSRTLGTKIKQNISSQIWKNKNANERYIHGIIEGKKKQYSGIPNFCLTKDPDEVKTAVDVFDNLISMDKLVKTHGNITSAFLAQNYRSHKHKQEGNRRHLAVWINWEIINGKLGCKYIFDNPLQMESGKVLENLDECLSKLGFEIKGGFEISEIKDSIDESVLTYS